MTAAMESRMGAYPQAYANLPASPTLTNPDMILPDYDFSLSSSVDDDEDHMARLQSPLMMWTNDDGSLPNTGLQQLYNGSQGQLNAFTAGPITPTTPIIYGNGTMLSDIGEVTEVESTTGPSPRSVRRRTAGLRTPSPTLLPHNIRHPFYNKSGNASDVPLQSSPTIGVENGPALSGSKIGVKQRARQQQQEADLRGRRDSLESNSTITTHEQTEFFAGFDDAASVGDDSVFLGDDEESVAESYVEETYVARQMPVASMTTSSLLAVPTSSAGGYSSGGNTSDEGDRRLSAATLSLRAEKILANAKRRLTTMEGNLNRARSSLQITSPSASSIPSDGSTPSPRTPKTPIRAATASSRYHDPTPGSPMHSRMVSDGSVSTNDFPLGSVPQRSASALGAAGGYRKPHVNYSRRADRAGQIQDGLSSGRPQADIGKPADFGLERLDEDSANDTDVLPSNKSLSAQSESYSSSALGSTNGEKVLNRSASVAQMRDLKDQMKGLKGKISSLREQARADSLKRRSLQSLRTPSPFTHAQIDQWATEQQQAMEKSPDSLGNDSLGQGHSNNGWDKGRLPAPLETEECSASGTVGRNAVPSFSQYRSSPGESGSLPHSSGSSSGRVRRSIRDSPLALDADQTDEDSVISRYTDPDDAMMTKLSCASSRPSRQSIDSPVLGEAQPSATHQNASLEEDGDLDDLRTEDGDFLDEDHSEPLEDDVFFDSSVADMSHLQYEARDGNGNHDPDRQPEPSTYSGREDDIDYESESGESLYLDTVQHPISHEDREDAFDYEHFILHSALGTISQRRLARSGSFSSEDSVETTRGPFPTLDRNGDQIDDFSYSSPNRRTSMSSISTVESADSFATAAEGRTSSTERYSTSSDAEGPLSGQERRAVSAAAAKDRPDSLLLARAAMASNGHAVSQHEDDYAAAVPATQNSAEEPRQTQPPSMARRPASAIPGHRPSASSFESTGTTRSFPLVNRNRAGSAMAAAGGGAATAGNSFRSSSGGSGSGTTTQSSTPTHTPAQTPIGWATSENEDLRNIRESILYETASICEQSDGDARSNSRLGGAGANRLSGPQTQALQTLSEEDRSLVELLVGNLGRCVLGLSEGGCDSAESHGIRQRMDAARRILEGLDPI
ncbi:hypothetical protein SEPCBS119000_006583 [Sporothrix epigloea]|uniref:Uncharacterized protein n=1 Tax=Sporothrix epigloea TaxID=1892477 RepID=A0ABP0E6Y1_9PEZI